MIESGYSDIRLNELKHDKYSEESISKKKAYLDSKMDVMGLTETEERLLRLIEKNFSRDDFIDAILYDPMLNSLFHDEVD
jgi:hypothetical protein